VLVNLLKISLQLPRPTPRTGYGFPSGDAGTAFSFAATMALAYPAFAPLLFLLATLAAIARLYFRAHFVWDILGGALMGTLCGKYLGRRFLRATKTARTTVAGRAIWTTTAILAVAATLFFSVVEDKIAEHKRSEPFGGVAQRVIDFGTPMARAYLDDGWSTDRKWRNDQATFNWVEGRSATLSLPMDSRQDSLLRFRAYPYRPAGFVCQWNEVRVNGNHLATIYLEQDWNTYEVSIPKALWIEGENQLQFHFPYSSNLNWHGINPNRKPLSVAFDILQLIPAGGR
jgi:hypothetical protein